MSTPVDFEIERIRAYVREKGWSRLRVAREAGMADTVLRKFNDADWNPTRETLQKLSAIVPADFGPKAGAAPAPRPKRKRAA